jgi:hypothetical protein
VEAVNQHYVPQFLLRRFAKNGQMRAYDMETGKYFIETVKQAASLDHFNRIENPDEPVSNDLERFFTKVEGLAAGAIARLVSGLWPLPTGDRDALAGFVALQAVRTKRTRDLIQAVTDLTVSMMAAETTRDEVRQAFEAIGRTLTEEELDGEWELWRGMRATAHPHSHLKTMLEVAGQAFPMLRTQRALGFVQFERRGLLICDHPVGLYSSLASDVNGIGIESAEEIWLPIDRRAAIVFTTELEQDTRFRPTTKLGQRINELVAGSARQWLYHHPEDTPFADLAEMPRPHASANVVPPEAFAQIDALYPDDPPTD